MADVKDTSQQIFCIVNDKRHIILYSFEDKSFGFVVGRGNEGSYVELSEKEAETLCWTIQAELERRFNKATEDY